MILYYYASYNLPPTYILETIINQDKRTRIPCHDYCLGCVTNVFFFCFSQLFVGRSDHNITTVLYDVLTWRILLVHITVNLVKTDLDYMYNNITIIIIIIISSYTDDTDTDSRSCGTTNDDASLTAIRFT